MYDATQSNNVRQREYHWLSTDNTRQLHRTMQPYVRWIAVSEYLVRIFGFFFCDSTSVDKGVATLFEIPVGGEHVFHPRPSVLLVLYKKREYISLENDRWTLIYSLDGPLQSVADVTLSINQGLELKGISYVTHTAVGTYCVHVPGVSSTQEPAIVSVDWSLTEDPEGNASAMFMTSCDGTGFKIDTDRIGTTATTTYADASAQDDVGFDVMIP